MSANEATKQSEQEYYLQLAANLKRLEELGDHEGVGQFWQVYGYQDCLRAESAAKKHAEPLPAPDVWEPEVNQPPAE